IPRRPYMFRDPKDWISAFLSRPGMEEAMDGSLDTEPHANSIDIFDGDYVRNFKGSNKQFFRLHGDEGHYVFSLFIDWYNPYTNKVSGIAASVGAVSLTCLNLPPLLRYKWENMYLAGIIPGPSEPSLEEVDHFVLPLI
ncbi:hypothetical protein K439DRAFT_1243732, partial [Ramaria rubella]